MNGGNALGKTGPRGAQSEHVEEIGQGVDGNDLGIEVCRKDKCRRTRSAADVGDLQSPSLKQTGQFDGAARFRYVTGSLPFPWDVKID